MIHRYLIYFLLTKQYRNQTSVTVHHSGKEVTMPNKSKIDKLNNLNWKEGYIENGKNKTSEELCVELKIKVKNLRDRLVPKRKVVGKPSWKEKDSVPRKMQYGTKDHTSPLVLS